MAPKNNDCVVYKAQSAEEVIDTWWALMQELGWDRGYNDLALHWHVTPSWPVVAPQSPSSSPPTSSASTTKQSIAGLCAPFIYDNSTGWLGFFIMQSAHRGRGWGAAVFQAALDEFAQRQVEHVGLDAVPAQKGTYERRGFRDVGRIKNMFRRKGAQMGMEKEMEESEKVEEGMRVVDARGVEQEKLVQFEEKATGFRRSRLWSKEGLWRRSEVDGMGFVALDLDGEVQGVVVLRDYEKGYRVGPLYATSETLARHLLNTTIAKTEALGAEMMAAEVNMANEKAVKLLLDAGWEDAGVDYYRMWIDGKATPQQMPGGAFSTLCWAEFDASEG